MRVYVTPNQVPRFNGFGAFGETNEEHCSRIYANCPALLEKCRQKACVDLPFIGKVCSNDPPPWTIAGKVARGLPMNGQCPGGVSVQQPPVQQPQIPAPVQQPTGPVVVIPPMTGGGIVPSLPPVGTAPAAPGVLDQLLANKPLLYGGGAALAALVAWMALGRKGGTSAMGAYRRKRKARRIH